MSSQTLLPDTLRRIAGSRLWFLGGGIGLLAALGIKPQPVFAGWECLTDSGSACCYECDTGAKPETCNLGQHCLFPNKSWFLIVE